MLIPPSQKFVLIFFYWKVLNCWNTDFLKTGCRFQNVLEQFRIFVFKPLYIRFIIYKLYMYWYTQKLISFLWNVFFFCICYSCVIMIIIIYNKLIFKSYNYGIIAFFNRVFTSLYILSVIVLFVGDNWGGITDS